MGRVRSRNVIIHHLNFALNRAGLPLVYFLDALSRVMDLRMRHPHPLCALTFEKSVSVLNIVEPNDG